MVTKRPVAQYDNFKQVLLDHFWADLGSVVQQGKTVAALKATRSAGKGEVRVGYLIRPLNRGEAQDDTKSPEE